MYKSIAFAGLAFALALHAAAVAARPDLANSHSIPVPKPVLTAQEAVHEADGRIVRIETDSIVLAHGPVASAGWPAMTMPFELASPELAAGLSAGDAVRFRFIERDGRHVVTHLARIRP